MKHTPAYMFLGNDTSKFMNGSGYIPFTPSVSYSYPSDFAGGTTLQQAIDSGTVLDRDTLIVAPGMYGPVQLSKSITLASEFIETGDPDDILVTVLQSAGGDVLTVAAGVDAHVVGFTISGAASGSGVNAAAPDPFGNFKLAHCVV